MPAAATAEEGHPNPENETHYTKDERVLIPQGLACSWSCMPEGCAMRRQRAFQRDQRWGSQTDILKYLGKYSFEAKATTTLPYTRSWERWAFQSLLTPRQEYSEN